MTGMVYHLVRMDRFVKKAVLLSALTLMLLSILSPTAIRSFPSSGSITQTEEGLIARQPGVAIPWEWSYRGRMPSSCPVDFVQILHAGRLGVGLIPFRCSLDSICAAIGIDRVSTGYLYLDNLHFRC